jgi:hypothetical protein
VELKALGELLVMLASERPTPIGVDVFWDEDPLPMCPHGDTEGKCRPCYYESSSAFDEAREDHIERSRRLRMPCR